MIGLPISDNLGPSIDGSSFLCTHYIRNMHKNTFRNNDYSSMSSHDISRRNHEESLRNVQYLNEGHAIRETVCEGITKIPEFIEGVLGIAAVTLVGGLLLVGAGNALFPAKDSNVHYAHKYDVSHCISKWNEQRARNGSYPVGYYAGVDAHNKAATDCWNKISVPAGKVKPCIGTHLKGVAAETARRKCSGKTYY
jgi:hypothetical protein